MATKARRASKDKLQETREAHKLVRKENCKHRNEVQVNMWFLLHLWDELWPFVAHNSSRCELCI